MNEQLSFLETPRTPTYCLFLAIFPDSSTAQSIIQLAKRLRQEYRMYGRVRPLTHLHVSLHAIDTRNMAIETVYDVCKMIIAAAPAFEISFDCVMSFQRRTGSYPLVLAGDNRKSDGVRRLHSSLYTEFKKRMPYARLNSNISPHITLLYDKQLLACKFIEPIYWTVKEIVLVCSEVGATKYTNLGRWQLGP